MKKKDIRDALRFIGSKGGKAGTGKAKRRGDSDYYRKLSAMRKIGVRKQRKEST